VDKAAVVLDSVFRFMNVIIQAAAAMVKRAVLMILPVVVAVVGVQGAVEKEAVVLYRDVILVIVILMAVKVNLNVLMILPVVVAVVGVMELVVRPEVVH